MIKNNWEVELIGALAENEFVQEKAMKSTSVFINSQNSIQFLIKVVSDTPEDFPNTRLFNCYTSDLSRFGFEDDIRLIESDRTKLLREYLNDRLVIFRPNRKILQDRTQVYQAKDVKIVIRNDSYTEQTFMPVPVFSQKEHEINFDEFMLKLIERKHVGRIDNISHEPNDTPEFILWKNDDDQFIIIGKISSHSYAHGGFNFNFKDSIKECLFKDVWLEDAYSSSETLLFLGIDTYTEILRELDLIIVKEPEAENDSENATTERLIDGINVQNTDETIDIIGEENNFVERLLEVTREQGFLYEERDLYNFHTAMKSSTLVILAGMSGTGKSRLVQYYGKSLMMDNQQLTIIPVRPAWSDDADLIGYVDSIHMVYRPGDSGLINTLIEAERNQNSRLYIICFDEMNLARVEHYFSQFLSVLEMEPGRRKLRLYNEELEQRLYNSVQYPPSILIGDNVIFVGTVNLDESTYHFSDKVLDRANIIKLNVKNFNGFADIREFKEVKDEKKRKMIDEFSDVFEKFDRFKNKDTTMALSKLEIEFLWSIHEDLQLANKNLGIGPRILKQIDMYLKNLPQNNFLSRCEAFDLQLVQRILTKLRGPEDQLKVLIGTVNSATGVIENSKLIERFNEFQSISSFTESIRVIEQKAKELKINGYTL